MIQTSIEYVVKIIEYSLFVVLSLEKQILYNTLTQQPNIT